MIRNNTFSYGNGAKFLHWLIALMLIVVFTIGYVMTNISKSSFRLSLYDVHKATGLLIFTLVILRLVWRFLNVQPDTLRHIPKSQKYLAQANILLLYILMLALPLTGFLRSYIGGYPIDFYHLFTLTSSVTNHNISEIFSTLHVWVGYIIAGAFCLHIFAAFYHQFHLRDGLLQQMWFSKT